VADPAGPPPRRGRVLGVDVGEVRTGLAVSDPDRMVATPLDTIPGGSDLARRLAARARQESCDTVVIGLPLSMSGTDTESTRQARAVAAELRDTGVAVELWDERLSSVEAERALLGAGRRRAQRRSERDRVAAAIILQGWLDMSRR
jgi:putative Holliday junction resolvase